MKIFTQKIHGKQNKHCLLNLLLLRIFCLNKLYLRNGEHGYFYLLRVLYLAKYVYSTYKLFIDMLKNRFINKVKFHTTKKCRQIKT